MGPQDVGGGGLRLGIREPSVARQFPSNTNTQLLEVVYARGNGTTVSSDSHTLTCIGTT